MVSLFKKRRKDVGGPQNERSRILKKLEETRIRLQKSCACWMQGKSERLSDRDKLTALLLFILLSGGYSIYVVTKSLSDRHADKHTEAFRLQQIKMPVSPIKHEQDGSIGSIRDGPVISKREYRTIHRFKLYMDSLSHCPLHSSGRSLYDSITAKRPGLMDSLRLVENIYQSQIK